MWVSVAVAHSLGSCDAWAQVLKGMWDPPGPGIEPMSPCASSQTPNLRTPKEVTQKVKVKSLSRVQFFATPRTDYSQMSGEADMEGWSYNIDMMGQDQDKVTTRCFWSTQSPGGGDDKWEIQLPWWSHREPWSPLTEAI